MTLKAWRIIQAHHAKSAFTGEGARRYGGRWNQRGTPMVYIAGSLSLAALEMLVHLEASEVLNTYVCIPVSFSDSLCRKLDTLPDNWADDPAPSSTKDIGTAWGHNADSVVLAVPSVLIPEETNYLINPLHPDFGKLQIDDPEPFQYDPRLIKTS